MGVLDIYGFEIFEVSVFRGYPTDKRRHTELLSGTCVCVCAPES